jgi:Flp pilus assembly protein TadD
VPEPREPVVLLKEEAPEETSPPAAEPAPDPNVGVARAAQMTRDASTALLRGEVARAVELSRAATVADEDNSRAWRTLGLALERTGSSREAVSAYKRYLLLSPTGPEADMVRQRIQALGH